MAMLGVLDASPIMLASALAVVQAFCTSMEPEMARTPFLNESCSATTGMGISMASIVANGSATSRVRGTDKAKLAKTTVAMMAAEIQRRLCIMRQ